MKSIALLSLALAGCSASGPVTLIEGYCTANEADRCFYDRDPHDGF